MGGGGDWGRGGGSRDWGRGVMLDIDMGGLRMGTLCMWCVCDRSLLRHLGVGMISKFGKGSAI